MGKFIPKTDNGKINYDVLNKKAFDKLFDLQKVMKFEKFLPGGGYTRIQTYFDTPNNLLNRAGVMFSKIIEKGKSYFAIERLTSIAQNFRFEQDKIFMHEIGPRDKITDHTLYLIDGITSFCGTAFSIDLENVLKTVIPKLEIITKNNTLRFVSGTGFRSFLHKQEITYKNYVTKRKVTRFGLLVENDSPAIYNNQFVALNNNIEIHCKEFLPLKENEYDYALRITKKLEPKPKTDKKKRKKEENILDKIEG